MGSCPFNKCNGSGFLPKLTEDGDEVFTLCDCRLDRANKIDLNAKLIGAFFPVKLTIYSFEEFLKTCSAYMDADSFKHNSTQLKDLQEYISNPQKFMQGPDVLWVWGKHLSGRTSLTLALGKALLLAGVKVRYIVIEQLTKLFKNFSSSDYSDRIAALEKFEVYIIDDLLDENSVSLMTKYDYQQLYSFIKLGMLDNKKFIFISNMSINVLDNISCNGYDVSGLQALLMKSYKEFHIAGDLKRIVAKINKYS